MSKRDLITRPDRAKEALAMERGDRNGSGLGEGLSPSHEAGPSPRRVFVISANPLKRATWCRTCSVLGALPTPLADLRMALQLVSESPPRGVIVLLDDTSPDPDPEGTDEGIDALLAFASSRVARVLRVVRSRGAPPPARSRVSFLAMPVTEADLYPLLSGHPPP